MKRFVLGMNYKVIKTWRFVVVVVVVVVVVDWKLNWEWVKQKLNQQPHHIYLKILHEWGIVGDLIKTSIDEQLNLHVLNLNFDLKYFISLTTKINVKISISLFLFFLFWLLQLTRGF
jgi:hypothetical protein